MLKIRILKIVCLGFSALIISFFLYFLQSPSGVEQSKEFRVVKGEGLAEIAAGLEADYLIRSPAAFKIYAFVSGSARHLKPGDYFLSPSWSVPKIVKKLVAGIPEDVIITVIEGETVADINVKLGILGILREEEELAQKLEGYLFPDTYRFFLDSSLEEIEKKFSENFNKKALSTLETKTSYQLPVTDYQILIMASLIEKEIPFSDDRFLVSGILWKRLKSGMALQVDASICYAKLRTSSGCRLSKSDFDIDSVYNTYKYAGLPPTPIGNPGLDAIYAALHPRPSEYWYYLSDPKTKKTIFSETLDEHNDNRAKYLGI
ncbi:MAG: hypothetical protein A2745_00760 [Candidatus Harrisonbacteria bacterium RIFCSPHIGHO2_01_FULL_44_13]|uniref:Endolytic murein transglycosylase n=1 Tax=Candidatus Harrisonbacteria bacterium RIFCSPLOWO2_01_FULL_44_18 TaxID=1798407 RepID=A0A1G1ZNT3_9BACT|nr:MAG: hypothetical protein A2745_00760 [Candidatus Harrisonbacteria bacterium RIFCSPHIGHO2_01_FULL_44_13]OGY66165.1 MAG: hypothetical protein A3A16_02595 [Candidatus Harrisonbacteria bacterium RIFCSPLOWO2_01_FULL_44_18]